MHKKLPNMLVCPRCHHALDYQNDTEQLACWNCQLAFPIEDDIPIMLLDVAKPLHINKDA